MIRMSGENEYPNLICTESIYFNREDFDKGLNLYLENNSQVFKTYNSSKNSTSIQFNFENNLVQQ